jgi:5-methylcytosine-specific restriction endonuclease McrA
MISKWTLTAQSTFVRRKNINTNPDYQRPAVWTRAQKQLLIDSMLREYDIPKMYMHRTGKDTYDVIDGQQRLRTIWEFFSGGFALAKDADPVDGIEIAGKKYDDLDMLLLDKLNSYNLDFVILNDVSDDEISEMFLRLQNGTTLKAQEKRNAYPGNMRNFIKDLATHPFFVNVVNFQNSRFSHEHVAAQLTLLTMNGDICDIKDRNLNAMYKDNQDFDVNGDVAKKIKRVLNYLLVMFPDKTPELKRYNVVSIYALIKDLLENYAIKGRESEIAKWFIDFEIMRTLEAEKPEDQQDARLAIYQSKTKDSTDAMDSLRYRHEFLKENLLSTITDLEPKDTKRNFDEAQRQVIYRRDKGICQQCGTKCEWNAWQADHIIPWNRGGKTIVSNGQVLCPTCNASKSDNI